MKEKDNNTDQPASVRSAKKTEITLDSINEREIFLSRLAEQTTWAFRHLVEEHMEDKGFPVGFSIVFYNPETYEKRWYYDSRVMIDGHDPSFQARKVRDRVGLILQFLSEGIKRILGGKHDDMIVDPSTIDGQSFQIPGLEGKG